MNALVRDWYIGFGTPLKLYAAVQTRIKKHLWERYHQHRHQLLSQAFEAAKTSSETFATAVEDLDEFYRWDLAYWLDRTIAHLEQDTSSTNPVLVKNLQDARRYLNTKL